jgi:hypothetical protein
VELEYGSEDNRHPTAAGAFADMVGTALRAKRVLLQSPLDVSRPVPKQMRLSVAGQFARTAGVGDASIHSR